MPDAPRSVAVTLRQKFELIRQYQTNKTYDRLTPNKKLDCVCFREATEGLYTGVEVKITDDAAIAIRKITRTTTHPTAGRPASVRLSGLWKFLGSTALAVVVAFLLSWMESAGGRAKLVALALPFVGMVWGLLQMITGRQIDDLEAGFARIPVVARVPVGCLGGAALLLACAALVAVIWRLVSGLAPAPRTCGSTSTTAASGRCSSRSMRASR